ncbi:glutamine amidotransferase [Tessaracoccus sp. ZS01]|uniref:glutamine amidotransferase n=1 Tax=Tessaracoccus sp. ZS01 TaxID=1906324 RepID=UPI00096F141B|nr:glutamine amidotransferase [Tessaracoccus sp. ZS01]MCG6567828.1 cytoplasmic protein [Tessaracoccus sp. ZS01]OMG55560.1 cytoplasmic protein [Tessaracoccus sp. ZS01]
MSRVLLAGESWVSAVDDHKGYDVFPHTQVHIGCAELLVALAEAGHEVTHLRSHDVATDFPLTLEGLEAYDVVILSDVGANTLLLPPVVFEEGRRAPNRLKLLREWVLRGGGLMMAGGYLSFQGFQAKANYHDTAVEEVLPVTILPYDDRVEAPEGVEGTVVVADHDVTRGLDGTWPAILGYQKLTAREDATVLAEVEGRPLLVVRQIGAGRTLAYASDISPHWAPKEFMAWAGYGRLFGNAVTWLAG